MAIWGLHKSNVNRSDDTGDYVARFQRDALFLIVAGHARLVAGGDDYRNTDEEDITGRLVQQADDYINGGDSPEWAKYYVVQEEPRENVRGKAGKHRPRVDIAFVLAGRRPQRKMRFEAKRLRRPGFTVAKYIGKEGLGEFIAGNYAADDDRAGMLGYVQSDGCNYWAGKIADALTRKKNKLHLTDEGQWEKAAFEHVDQCYTTRHNRPTLKRSLLVYHLLLTFTE